MQPESTNRTINDAIAPISPIGESMENADSSETTDFTHMKPSDLGITEAQLDEANHLAAEEVENIEDKNKKVYPLTQFRNHFVGYMDLFAEQSVVMTYLDSHQGWFKRCAHPFKAEPIGTTGYAMGVGRVGAFGYYVYPNVGLNLLPQENSVYRIVTIPIPDQEPQGYEVDFQAEMRLQPRSLAEVLSGEELAQNPTMTSIEWDLNLTVTLQFPPFIHRMSKDMIQKTGDGVLAFVVKHVSNSLTAKVQNDFHKTHNIKVPKKVKLRK
ncbi:DUF1997 domain-containing protein [Tumidithrix elongata RA019]|uniref:DUF1997 domain-containing protein n=1 Tax=Tumidithrix elongata BACA0141 TaxID=2716417 RepID=A0AAW9PRS9_9CYAN|nr:DUF1997 domain-containing protein [Tumidithrix elongata RA019]